MSDATLEESLNHLWPYPKEIEFRAGILAPGKVFSNEAVLPGWFCKDLSLVNQRAKGEVAQSLVLEAREDLPAEGYELEVEPARISLRFADARGKQYGLQTLSQLLLLGLAENARAGVLIKDAPAYARRAFMVDMGRSFWSLPMLRRLVRMLARLKMNLLHLHLLDDELCGFRFEKLPFGQENPHALDAAGLAELGRYAQEYGVDLMVELETWGHVGSLVYHQPELRGGPGMWGGSSLLVGEAAFSMVRKMMEEIVPALPPNAWLHLGLDEAKWFPGADLPPGFGPKEMVAVYEQMAGEVFAELGRDDIRLVAYADHEGRELPPGSQTILQPWNYWIKDRADIDRKLAFYGRSFPGQWFPMAGQSMAQHRGAFCATRHWCKGGATVPNLVGVDIALWGRNDLADRFITLFAGAQYVWNPFPKKGAATAEEPELFDCLAQHVIEFQERVYDDLNLDAWRAESVELVYRGFYMRGALRGKPAAPTVSSAGTNLQQAFYDEVSRQEG